MRCPALALATYALACAGVLLYACAGDSAGPHETGTTGSTGACFGCDCGPDVPCKEGLECTHGVCSIIDETGGGDEAPPSTCGWNPAKSWYDCGFEGDDPSGEFPRACSSGLTPDVACPASLPFEGCCDAESNVWYCDDGVAVMTGC